MPETEWPVGTRVQVRNRFESAWVSGFEVADVPHEDGSSTYQLLRISDRAVLPSPFSRSEVRAEVPIREQRRARRRGR